MRMLILMAPVLLLAAASPAHSQGAQFPNAENATSPPSLNSPPLASLNSPPRRAVRYRRHRQLRRHRPATSQQSFLRSAVPQLG